MSISNKLRQLIFARDDFSCVACGSLKDLSIHHRVNRGAGGSKLFDKPAFLLTMCITCNGKFESDVELARKARLLGYKLHRNHKPPADPTAIEVYYSKTNQWFKLDNQGKRNLYVQ